MPVTEATKKPASKADQPLEQPVTSRNGNWSNAVWHSHSGARTAVKAVKVAKWRGNGTHYQTIALWCPVCGFKLTKLGKSIQAAELLRIAGG